jgi:DNA-binding XRE family transcriptional regulator
MTVATKPFTLYRLYGADKRLLYVGITGRGLQRVREHATTKEWWEEVAEAEFETFDSLSDLSTAERRQIRTLRPLYNHGVQPTREAIKVKRRPRSSVRMTPHVGERLRELRTRKYLTQRELAALAGMSPATIAKLETNVAEPRPGTIRKLAEALERVW